MGKLLKQAGRFVCVAALAIAVPLAAHDEPQTGASNAAAASRLALAEQIALKTVPEGALSNALRDLIEFAGGARYIGPLQDQPKVRLARLTGVTMLRLGEVSRDRIQEAVLLLDPQFTVRNTAKQSAYERAFGELLQEVEPAYRSGVAKAYAGRYTQGELRELLAFFSTDTGAKYAAAEWDVGGEDPVTKVFEDRADVFQSAMVAMEKEFREIGSEFPRGRQFSQLSKDEQSELQALLDISAQELESLEPQPLVVPEPDPDHARARRIRGEPRTEP